MTPTKLFRPVNEGAFQDANAILAVGDDRAHLCSYHLEHNQPRQYILDHCLALQGIKLETENIIDD